MFVWICIAFMYIKFIPILIYIYANISNVRLIKVTYLNKTTIQNLKYLNTPLNTNYKMKTFTWNILGALTREASADESVAEKIPAEIKGANPDTMLITLNEVSKLESKS